MLFWFSFQLNVSVSCAITLAFGLLKVIHGFKCNDGCDVQDIFLDDNWCDCSSCEDEQDWTCFTCGGCPNTCSNYTQCGINTLKPTTTSPFSATTVTKLSTIDNSTSRDDKSNDPGNVVDGVNIKFLGLDETQTIIVIALLIVILLLICLLLSAYYKRMTNKKNTGQSTDESIIASANTLDGGLDPFASDLNGNRNGNTTNTHNHGIVEMASDELYAEGDGTLGVGGTGINGGTPGQLGVNGSLDNIIVGAGLTPDGGGGDGIGQTRLQAPKVIKKKKSTKNDGGSLVVGGVDMHGGTVANMNGNHNIVRGNDESDSEGSDELFGDHTKHPAEGGLSVVSGQSGNAHERLSAASGASSGVSGVSGQSGISLQTNGTSNNNVNANVNGYSDNASNVAIVGIGTNDDQYRDQLEQENSENSQSIIEGVLPNLPH